MIKRPPPMIALNPTQIDADLGLFFWVDPVELVFEQDIFCWDGRVGFEFVNPVTV